MVPVISIIVPVYNTEPYLKQCLTSILCQDFKQWECLLIDDGSKDRSGAICDEYAMQDCRFNVVHKTNGGVSSARNVGLAMAKGEWICFVDSDDRLVADALSYMLKLNTRTNADVCLCPIVKDQPYSPETKVLNDAEKDRLIWSCLTYRTLEYAKNGFMIDAPHAKLFRASVIKKNQLRYVEGLCKSEDALFDAQFYHHSTRIAMDAYPVYMYTINPNSICHTYKFQNISMFDTLLQLENEFLEKWYCNKPMFQNALKIRAFVALEQVLYEAGVDKLPLSQRIAALHLFMESEAVNAIITDTLYFQIAPHIYGRSRRVDLFLIKRRMYHALCLWVDLCKSIFRLRVSIVGGLKKLLHIDKSTSFSSLFHK